MIQVYQRGGSTLGDSLIAMCLFNSLKEQVCVTTRIGSWYTNWKSILNINDQVTVNEVENCETWKNPPHPMWIEGFKVFSRYIEPETVNLYGQQFTTGKRGKKCAAILVNNGEYPKDQTFFDRVQYVIDNKDHSQYPFDKFYTKKAYQRILELVQEAGYEPIIIDHKSIPLEQKVFVLNELCDFVIGYEGGLTHLAHVLRIPAIIMPWTGRPNEVLQYMNTEHIHLDKKSFFVRNAVELDSWTAQHLTEIVDQLYNNLGNNRWLVGTDPGPYLDYLKGSPENFLAQVRWGKEHIENPTLGGF